MELRCDGTGFATYTGEAHNTCLCCCSRAAHQAPTLTTCHTIHSRGIGETILHPDQAWHRRGRTDREIVPMCCVVGHWSLGCSCRIHTSTTRRSIGIGIVCSSSGGGSRSCGKDRSKSRTIPISIKPSEFTRKGNPLVAVGNLHGHHSTTGSDGRAAYLRRNWGVDGLAA